MDNISKLPAGIIETILCLLPIQEAARTSILSKEWRYHWTKIPKLAFIQDTFQVSADGNELSFMDRTFGKPRSKFFCAIYQVLLMHQAPMYEFSLSVAALGARVEIDLIILHLLKRNTTVKKLKLDLTGQYKLPLSLFSLHQLTDLYLEDCVLDHLPSSFVFGCLTTLNIQEIRTCEKTLLRLLSRCPLLKRLTIMSDGGTIEVSGDFTIVDLFECLPVVEYLSIWFFIFECFLPLPKVPPTKLVNLKCLCMECVCFCYERSLPFFVLLFRSSPNLEKLKLQIIDEESHGEHEMTPFTIEDYPDIMLEHLKELEILDFNNDENGLAFVKYILAKSPALKKVTILLCDQFTKKRKLQISKNLLSFSCASPAVKIIVS